MTLLTPIGMTDSQIQDVINEFFKVDVQTVAYAEPGRWRIVAGRNQKTLSISKKYNLEEVEGYFAMLLRLTAGQTLNADNADKMITKETLKLLKEHGFKWFKDYTTDTVNATIIKDILPAENGFTVVYRDTPEIVLIASTATVEKIVIPEDIYDQWIFVHWNTIKDEQ